MNYWILPDTHFGHGDMEDWCHRPKGFENKILKALGICLKPDDVLIHLGDICWDFSWHPKLMAIPCKKWLVLGNHDGKSMTYPKGESARWSPR